MANERFYREARVLASQSTALLELSSRPMTDSIVSRYEATIESERKLQREMRDAGYNPDASPDIRGCLLHVDRLKAVVGPVVEGIRRTSHGVA